MRTAGLFPILEDQPACCNGRSAVNAVKDPQADFHGRRPLQPLEILKRSDRRGPRREWLHGFECGAGAGRPRLACACGRAQRRRARSPRMAGRRVLGGGRAATRDARPCARRRGCRLLPRAHDVERRRLRARRASGGRERAFRNWMRSRYSRRFVPIRRSTAGRALWAGLASRRRRGGEETAGLPLWQGPVELVQCCRPDRRAKLRKEVRTPPGRRSFARVTSRWMARMTISRNASIRPGAAKLSARAGRLSLIPRRA